MSYANTLKLTFVVFAGVKTNLCFLRVREYNRHCPRTSMLPSHMDVAVTQLAMQPLDGAIQSQNWSRTNLRFSFVSRLRML